MQCQDSASTVPQKEGNFMTHGAPQGKEGWYTLTGIKGIFHKEKEEVNSAKKNINNP